MRTSRLLSGKRCLLAEANLHERRQVTSVLRGSGITHTQSYSNGIDALEDIALNEFHFAIVSENLDGLNGRELVSMIRRHKLKTVNQIPIIFMKSAIRKRDVAEIARCGVHEVVAKPFSARILLDRIRWATAMPRPFVTGKGYFGPEPRGPFWRGATGLHTENPPQTPCATPLEASTEAEPAEIDDTDATGIDYELDRGVDDIDVINL